MSELLHLERVTKTVRLPDDSPLEILAQIDLAVDPGDRVAIVGRSGTGKSTLLNVLGLIDRPTTGTLWFDGRDCAKLSPGRTARTRGRDIGFVFQQFNLLDGRTALDNVCAPLMYAGAREFWSRRRRGLEVLDLVGLADRADSAPDRLSGGEQQRVAIARALVRRPRLILADEPTGALDVETGAAVMGLLEAATRDSGAALITITHDINVANRADRLLRLEDGRLHDINEPDPALT